MQAIALYKIVFIAFHQELIHHAGLHLESCARGCKIVVSEIQVGLSSAYVPMAMYLPKIRPIPLLTPPPPTNAALTCNRIGTEGCLFCNDKLNKATGA